MKLHPWRDCASSAHFRILLFTALLLVCFGVLRGEKLLVTRFTSLGVDMNTVKLEVATKLFIGELTKGEKTGLYVLDTGQECATVACAVAVGKEEGVDKVVDSLRLEQTKVEKFDDDIMISGYVRKE